MNQERVRERQGQFNGHEHNHAGQHSHLRGLDASQAQLDEHRFEQPDLVEGNLPDLFEPQPYRECLDIRAIDQPLPRNGTIFEIGKRAMRRITRDGKR